MHWYIYNNTVCLLNIVKSQILYPVYNLKISLFRLPASQPTCLPHVRPSSTSAMAPDLSQKKDNCIKFMKLQFQRRFINCAMVFLLSVAPFFSLLLPYKKVTNFWKRCRSSATASDCVAKKTAAYTHEHNYESCLYCECASDDWVCFFTSSTSKQHDYRLEQTDFRCFSIVICNNTAAFPCKCYC